VTNPDVLIFDLFGTLVFFDDSRVPTMELSGHVVPLTVTGLPQLLAELLPEVSITQFLRELRAVSKSIQEQKRREHVEIPTSVRFERTLLGLGCPPAVAIVAARSMASLHMDTLARSVVCPPDRAGLLARLSERYRLALLSNFDDGSTARRVLSEAGLASSFDAIVISQEEGIRKPSPEIFARACRKLSASPADCLYIGDTHVEDVEGAHGAGLSALWIQSEQPREQPAEERLVPSSPAVAVLDDVRLLPQWLASRFPA
jgi:putative hydrolase of the HAD superfamily